MCVASKSFSEIRPFNIIWIHDKRPGVYIGIEKLSSIRGKAIIGSVSCSMQIDLIDMRHRPDGPYHWVGHFMDHWSKMLVLFPLMHKSAKEVVLNLSTKVFAYFGPPKILQSDNGTEFVNSTVHKLIVD